MKTLKLLTITLFAVLLTVSCNKKDETPILDATTEEAAAIMATSFCTDNAGTMSQVADAIELSQNTELKSSLYDSSFTISSAPGAAITYQYQVNYSYGFLNSGNFQLAYESKGNYTSPNVNATISAAGSMNVTGFLSGDYYVVNGQSGRDGTFTMKIGNKNSITGSVTTTLVNFKVSKTTGLLESGTATIVVNGSTSAGMNFGFTGALVYTGNYTGTLTIEGKQFIINISTGTIQ
jgi:hypothetical protein